MQSVKTIKNTTSIPQSIIFNGRQFVVGAFAEETFEEALADKFLEICSPVIQDTSDDFGQSYAPELQQKTTWLANVTGNPDAPDKIRVKQLNKDRRYEEVEITNPNKAARVLSRESKGGHNQYTAKDGGLVQMTADSKRIEIPPFRRRPVESTLAQWFVQRDSGSLEYAGAVIVSRPPSNFEPDMSWRLNEMRAYMKLLDPSADLGLDEDHLADKAKNEKWDAKQAAEALRQTKQELLRRLYFRIVDPKYRLPTKKEFNEFLTGKSEDDISKEELEAILEPKKPFKKLESGK